MYSTLRRLKTWLRIRTGEERLTGLALMNIGGKNQIDLTDDKEILDSVHVMDSGREKIF